jgi:hypothetical protein
MFRTVGKFKKIQITKITAKKRWKPKKGHPKIISKVMDSDLRYHSTEIFFIRTDKKSF